MIVHLANKDEKRDQRELQELCQRLMEATASIAGTALEQATWFRRGLQIRSTAVPAASSTTDMTSVSTDLRPAASESALSDVAGSASTPPQDSNPLTGCYILLLIAILWLL